VTEDGILIDVRRVHPSNTLSAILVTEDVSENVTDVRPRQSLNTRVPILVTEDGIIIDDILLQL
jgi:hypothetical protein